MEAAVLRYHKHLDRFVQLQKTRKQISEMYRDQNTDQSIVGCFGEVRNILGNRPADVLVVNEVDPTSVQLAYDEERIPQSVLPALGGFNEASRLVKELLQEGPLLAVSVDDVIFAENAMRAKIATISKGKEASAVNRCLDHYLYDIRQFYYIKTMLGKIKDETRLVHCQLQEAVQEMGAKRAPGDTMAICDDLVKLDTEGTLSSGVSEANERSIPMDQEQTRAQVQETPYTNKNADVDSASRPTMDADAEAGDRSVVRTISDDSSSKQATAEVEGTPDNEQTPDVSVADQTPDVSVAEHTPDVSVAEQTPDVSVAENTPDVSVAEQTSNVSVAEQPPDVSVSEQTREVSVAEHTLGVSTTEQTPDVSVTEKSSDASVVEHTGWSPDESDPDRTPDTSRDNCSTSTCSTDQRTMDTTTTVDQVAADISADFRTDESASFITDEGELSYANHKEQSDDAEDGQSSDHQTTRESFEDSESFRADREDDDDDA
ncbi:hypothetical protein LSH36_474g04027 [Paralvinella palmiformis]|uniref:Uncharacterized protein n=1 Tax=Paralvinella palmiformis TaxID=53620 RepID=A0AAD9MX16_9ANNE|nr:hypothetical protein LSH36_474g04027 [Paralvinella palmiformis]